MKNTLTAIAYGVATVFIIGLIISLIFATVLRFTSVNEASLSMVMTFITGFTLFIGGFISGGKGKKKGLVTGMLTGASYSFIVFLVQYLGYQNLFSIEQLLYHSGFITVAAIGGAIGVNTAAKSG